MAMHSVASLVESPMREESHQAPSRPTSEGSVTDRGRSPSDPPSPHARPGTSSSASPTVTNVTNASAMAVDGSDAPKDHASPNYTTTASPGDAMSPTFASQASFSVAGANDAAAPRRPSRRRTGPLSAPQREKAALIRKLGACIDCRRRRVACHPSHHGMGWEDAVRKFMPHPPTGDYPPLTGRLISPAQSNGRHSFGQADAQDMDVDTDMSPIMHAVDPRQHQHAQHAHASHQAHMSHHNHNHHNHHHGHPQSPLPVQHQQPLSRSPDRIHPPPSLPPPQPRRLSTGADARLRTPLPSGPRMDKFSAPPLPPGQTALPGIESLVGELQSATARVINEANASRSRYERVQVLVVLWSNDSDAEVHGAVDELSALLGDRYHYSVERATIPVGAQSPLRWLLQTVNVFINNSDLRNTLKVFYYAGFTYLDRDRELVLSSAMDKTPGQTQATIRWAAIQSTLEDATADTLLLMDSAYYPCTRMTRREGVFEVVAAAVGQDPNHALGRAAFTRAVVDELRSRLGQRFGGPLGSLSAAELHVRLMSAYPALVEERGADRERALVTSCPAPFHMQVSASARLPSILLAPLRKTVPGSPEAAGSGPGTQLSLTVRLTDGGVVDKPGWVEWMRLMPEGVQDVKCESPFRSFR